MDYSPQAPLSMGLPRQEYWSGLQSPSPGYLPDPRLKPASPPELQADFFTTEPPGKTFLTLTLNFKNLNNKKTHPLSIKIDCNLTMSCI